MEMFRLVKVALLGTVVIIGLRIFAQGFGWDNVSLYAGYVGLALVCVSVVLAVCGAVRERNRSFQHRSKIQ